MADEGLREIQLNGKQLVFLFMAATVVAVVIFLCGVMVGRGVPMRAGSGIDAPAQAGLDPTAAAQVPVEQAVAADGSGPVAAQETLSYPGLLEDAVSPEETLTPVSETAVELREPVASLSAGGTAVAPRGAAAVSTPPAVAAVRPTSVGAVATSSPPRVAAVSPPPKSAAASAAAAAPTLAEPRGEGFVVQVAAVRQRAEADSIARRLSGKGYPAFVTTSGANFRVRVGKYNTRREAETVASRLEREERIEPWITR